MSMVIAMGAVNQGLLWSIMAIGIYISFRILDFPDLTAEGSFTLGAAVAVKLIVSGYDPVICTMVSIFAGMCAGIITGILHTKFKIPPLLSGILTMTALYSINIRIMEKSNISLLRVETIMTKLNLFELSKTYSEILIGVIVALIVILILWWFFNTEVGYSVRATGNNESMVKALGVNTSNIKILCLLIGNALVALSGALVAQSNNYAEVSMGTGTIVIGLASVIIGEVFFNNKGRFTSLIAVVIGSIVYRLIVAFVLSLGFPTTDLRLISAVLLCIALSLPLIKAYFKTFLTRQA